MRVVFANDAWDDYVGWSESDQALLGTDALLNTRNNNLLFELIPIHHVLLKIRIELGGDRTIASLREIEKR